MFPILVGCCVVVLGVFLNSILTSTRPFGALGVDSRLVSSELWVDITSTLYEGNAEVRLRGVVP